MNEPMLIDLTRTFHVLFQFGFETKITSVLYHPNTQILSVKFVFRFSPYWYCKISPTRHTIKPFCTRSLRSPAENNYKLWHSSDFYNINLQNTGQSVFVVLPFVYKYITMFSHSVILVSRLYTYITSNVTMSEDFFRQK